ncbi:hypothetical protein CSUI_010957 [Cystoisospora suis]|uniref:Transmembrane protein n=1 Tax=Cystoisospora suis TaxID=483139 RepID=A0A2C6J862_9APIC|nr:hypothetical protein CSUI_010957 [Cystoisospora suis]
MKREWFFFLFSFILVCLINMVDSINPSIRNGRLPGLKRKRKKKISLRDFPSLLPLVRLSKSTARVSVCTAERRRELLLSYR